MNQTNMKNLTVNNEWTNNTKETNDISWTHKEKLSDLTWRIEETKILDTKAPNPSKAPLNYIDNMWEWENAQKKYEKEIENKQQELIAILSTFEQKQKELNKFREEKTSLEINLGKNIWAIMKEMYTNDEIMTQIYVKINTFLEYIKNLETSNKLKEWDVIKDETEEHQIINNWEESEEQNDGWDPIEFIDRFLFINDHDIWNNFKEILDPNEITYTENVREKIKWFVNKYWTLRYQIKNLGNMITQLENEYNNINAIYDQKKEEAEKMVEDMQDLNETYFLNSYLSTKNVSLNDFVSSPLVEKQISNIIELSKQWKPTPKTILLYWKINLWKTYAANVLASELWRKMYHIRSYDIFTWWFSDPNSMLDAIFSWVIKKKESCIIFLDEIEDFSWWYDWSPYQNLLENTIRHHISKIKESNLDIIIIWSISDKNKVSSELLKQDVFSRQIYFTELPKQKHKELFIKMIKEKWINLWSDSDINEILEIIGNNTNLDQEYLKKLIDIAIDFNQLNDEWESEKITLSMENFKSAINFMKQYKYNFPQNSWFNN